MKRVTIILPSAGDGKRLGAQCPKELFEIYPGKKIIDFSLEHIKAFHDSKIRKELDIRIGVVVVIKPGKESVFRYVSEQLPNIAVNYVMFNNYFREWPGSVYSANNIFTEINIVLLPDTFIKFGSNDMIYLNGDGDTLISKAANILEKEKVVFGVINCTDRKKLSSLGAVRVINDKIEYFTDKPKENLNKYNGFWGIYGFRYSVAEQLYEFLIDSVEKRESKEYLLAELDPKVFYIDSYHDLGTIESVDKFINSR